jgi:hypothetical protein
VLSGDAGDIAWYSSDRDDRGFLVQWLGVDDERLVQLASNTQKLRDDLGSPKAEHLKFETGASGVMGLIDASDCGRDLRSDHQALAMRPGNYLATAAYYCSAGLAIVVREIRWVGSL